MSDSDTLKLDLDGTDLDFRFEFEASVDVMVQSEQEAGQAIFNQSEEEQRRQYELRNGSSSTGSMRGDDASRVCYHDGIIVASGLDLTEIPADLFRRYDSESVVGLDLSHNMLTQLEHLDEYIHTLSLNLDNNFLTETCRFPHMPRLVTLTLNNNRISDIDALLESLSIACPAITYLSLLRNQACPNELVEKDEDDYKRYRLYVINKLPNLKFLDSRPIGAFERQLAREQGEFLKVIKFTDRDIATQAPKQPQRTLDPGYTPLPRDERADHSRATIGTSRYVYHGRHSEGNRFIRNDDL